MMAPNKSETNPLLQSSNNCISITLYKTETHEANSTRQEQITK